MSPVNAVVGIPTYNNIQTIDQTLDYLERQERKPDEVIFCDNSDDDTVLRIKSWKKDMNFSVTVLNQNGDGVSDAYNQILSYLEDYDIFATIQTDIKIKSDWLKEHVKIHQQNPDIDILNGGSNIGNNITKRVSPKHRLYYVGLNFSAKRGVLESIDGWDSNFLRGEDWDMRIRLAGANTQSAVSEKVAGDHLSEPMNSLSKAKRKPTSLTFLKKFGGWYAQFHPSHVIADTISLGSILSAIGVLVFLPFLPVLSAFSVISFAALTITYWVGHIILLGDTNSFFTLFPTQKQLLNGIAVFYALNRLIFKEIEWNMTGFNPENIPRYKY